MTNVTLSFNVDELIHLATNNDTPGFLRQQAQEAIRALVIDGLTLREQQKIAVNPELNQFEKELAATNKIEAIKHVRQRYLNTKVFIGMDTVQFGLGLKDAKDLVDRYIEKKNAGSL